MTDDASIVLQALIDRIKRGDHAARRELLDRACNRLRRLVARLFSGSFAGLQHRHELDSVVHETWLRLAQALDKVDPPTVADFFRLAAHKTRQVLLDMAERERRKLQREGLGIGDDSRSGQVGEPGQQTLDPARLAQWTEFHKQVADLHDDERAVFEMHYYLDLPQVEIAKLLDLPPRQVSRLWIEATEKLADEAGLLG